MLTKLRTFASLYRELGFRWSAFRVAYAFRLRTGLIRLRMPQYKWTDRPLETWLKKNIPLTPESYAQWRKQNSPKFFFDAYRAPEIASGQRERSDSADEAHWNKQIAIEESDRILNGEIKYFAHEFHKTGFPPNWHSAPGGVLAAVPQGCFAKDGGLSKLATKHWSQISDDSEVDIKFIWEASRFSMVYTLVRAYATNHDERYAEAFWKLILDWAEHNPPNTGPNWMDGQEIALRLMAWTFGYYAFFDSPSTKPEYISQFTIMVAAQAERIYKNIDYAISTRSNHTISEALGLWLVGLLFPELKDAEKHLSLGLKLLEQEAAAQIFPDGSYSMYSLNYHRFVLHIYLYVIRLAELNQSPVSNLIHQAVASSIDYLSQLIDPQTGQMPVYGSNDGALVLPMNNCDFTDYRPLLQLGSYITQKEFLFEPGAWDEDVFWLCGKQALTLALSRKERGRLPSPSGRRAGDEGDGGAYILHNTNNKAIIRCTDFRARPSHADQLHVDLWLGSQNIACDAGTYLYSGEDRRWRNGLAHTSVHNTVIVDSKDQMTMVSRFTWTNWAKGKVLRNDERIWQGEHDGYKPVTHKRTVMMLDGDRWLVIDNLVAKESHHYALHWLLSDSGVQELDTAYGLSLSPTLIDSTHWASELSDSRVLIQMGLIEGTGNFSVVRADPNSTRGWRSRYYGHKEPAISAMLETDQPQTIFWTFFGFEYDGIELTGDTLKISSHDLETSVNLKSPVSNL